jgi:hypothetical protein
VIPDLVKIKSVTKTKGNDTDDDPDNDMPQVTEHIRLADKGLVESGFIGQFTGIDDQFGKGIREEKQRYPESDDRQEEPHDHMQDDPADTNIALDSHIIVS